MAWFGNWFSKKRPAADGLASDSELFDQGQAAKSAAAGSRNAAGRKSMRLEQRELLYAVMRETMARLGVITPNYKYKVLSLDPQGRQYLVMMDVKQDVQSQARLMSQIESQLTQEAKAKHDILITGIYWRFNDNKALADAESPSPPLVKPNPVEPVDPRKALEKSLNKPREHRAAAPTAFQDTLVLDPEERELPLSGTQLGALR